MYISLKELNKLNNVKTELMQIKKQKNIGNLKKFKILLFLYDVIKGLMNINEAAWIQSSWMLNIKFQIAIFQKPLKIIWCGFRQSPPYWSALKYLVELNFRICLLNTAVAFNISHLRGASVEFPQCIYLWRNWEICPRIIKYFSLTSALLSFRIFILCI